jgi:hypothetical protein
MKYTVATCAHLLTAPQWTLVDVELDAGTELNAMAQRSYLCCAQCESEREVRCAAEHGARHKRREAQVGRTKHEAQGARCARHGAGGSVLSGRTDGR